MLRKTIDGIEHTMIYQQYQSGLYVAVYRGGHLINQFGSSLTQDKFIKKAKKGGWE